MTTERYDINKLKETSARLLTELGLFPDDAAILVDSMLEADMAGISTHGIRMLPSYVEKIEKGFFIL